MITSIEDANVLFVDDEDQILKSIQRRIISEPYQCFLPTLLKRHWKF